MKRCRQLATRQCLRKTKWAVAGGPIPPHLTRDKRRDSPDLIVRATGDKLTHAITIEKRGKTVNCQRMVRESSSPPIVVNRNGRLADRDASV
jgi:hypothetical protein